MNRNEAFIKTSDLKLGQEILSDNSPFLFRESYKKLRTNMEFILNNEDKKVIMITSALSGEGKTTTAINLATSFGQMGKNILLLDCDMRKSGVKKILKVGDRDINGLSDILTGNITKKKTICKHQILNFYYILSGEEPENPVELLGSKGMYNIIGQIRTKFDYIICDLPPVLELADAVVFSKFCDAAVLVIRHNYALKKDVKKTKKCLEDVGTHVIGTVFNDYNLKADPTISKAKGSYYSYYGYSDYGK